MKTIDHIPTSKIEKGFQTGDYQAGAKIGGN
jgi:hypothetical protein